LKAADAAQLGTLMKEAQDNFDQFAIPACPEELEAPVLHRILNYPPLLPYIWGGKGVGSQGDGTAQFIARSKVDQENVVSIIENDLRLPCMQLTIHSGPNSSRGFWYSFVSGLKSHKEGTISHR
jgi:galactokinase